MRIGWKMCVSYSLTFVFWCQWLLPPSLLFYSTVPARHGLFTYTSFLLNSFGYSASSVSTGHGIFSCTSFLFIFFWLFFVCSFCSALNLYTYFFFVGLFWFFVLNSFCCLWNRHISCSCIVRTFCFDWLKFVIWWLRLSYYGVVTISRLLKIIGLFCKKALKKRLCSAKDTYNFKAPTNRSHPTRLSCPPLLFYGTVSIRHGVLTYT